MTYRDANTNEEILTPKSIAKNYISGEFWLDLVSTIPFDNLFALFDKGSGDQLVGLSMLKLTRMLRI